MDNFKDALKTLRALYLFCFVAGIVITSLSYSYYKQDDYLRQNGIHAKGIVTSAHKGKAAGTFTEENGAQYQFTFNGGGLKKGDTADIYYNKYNPADYVAGRISKIKYFIIFFSALTIISAALFILTFTAFFKRYFVKTSDKA